MVDKFLEGVRLWDIISSSAICVDGAEETFAIAVNAFNLANGGEYFYSLSNTTEFLGGFYPLSLTCESAMNELANDWNSYWGKYKDAGDFLTQWAAHLGGSIFYFNKVFAQMDV
jgi:hypothetical protein